MRLRLKLRPNAYFPFGFHVTRQAWERYGLGKIMSGGDGARADAVYTLRALADRMNAGHDHQTYGSTLVHAGQLAAMGVLTEVFRYFVDTFVQEEDAGVFHRAFEALTGANGPSLVEKPTNAFVDLYPPVAVAKGETEAPAFLSGSTRGLSNRHAVARELVLLYFSMANAALRPFRTLFDDEALKRQAPYEPLVYSLERFFEGEREVDASGLGLFAFLRAPLNACPDSLEGQLEFIIEHWAHLLPPELLDELFLATDLISEEVQMRGHGPGPAEVLLFGKHGAYDYEELEAFTHDRDWMSNVVLIAKSTYVWLDQLSKTYQRPITRLDQIPDEELDRLARWGFTGLWLIGVWERSPASGKIKQMTGNPEALPSAYSLYDYVIAADLGGEEAYTLLRERAWKRGIRLASDMVPNHVGLYSKWVLEHPDWFIQLDHPPFPSYQFNGDDLSWDGRVCLQIEDGYWEQRDAAVVFKRIDKSTGDTRYIYHGNDGTNMPWNDTAQLNYLLPEVREAVIETILHVARQFPIIRFDAAMTLAKKHYQRLWFPLPGDAGAIPSRAEHGMTRAEFDKAFPVEFWREVVDRINEEAPDTLLLAEAFWLMEGYFVRTLGMHRVYNSAFMNMLKMEENAKYRQTVKNVLEFTPEVLKRLVNFMNNPDERTAVDQFGKEDKYYGVALLMVTMPGLPMFGHGQIEGFTEKYGMEYRKAYWDETIDEHMVRRHEREIFPLMRRRRLFSGADNFAFFDFVTPSGSVDENVFAYTNRAGDERAIILFNNAYSTTEGGILRSTPINVGSGDHPELVQRSLAEALALNTGDGIFYTFRDHRSGLAYIRSGRELAEWGLSATLHAYQYQAYLDFQEIHDTDGSWLRLAERLAGRGVPSIETARWEMVLAPVLDSLLALLEPENIAAVAQSSSRAALALTPLSKALPSYVEAIAAQTGTDLPVQAVVTATLDRLSTAKDALGVLRSSCTGQPETLTEPEVQAEPETKAQDEAETPAMAEAEGEEVSSPGWPELLEDADDDALFEALCVEALVYPLGNVSEPGAPVEQAMAIMAEWPLTETLRAAFSALGRDDGAAWQSALLVQLARRHADIMAEDRVAPGLRRLMDDATAQQYLAMNRHQGVVWLNKEQLERLVLWLTCSAFGRLPEEEDEATAEAERLQQRAEAILDAAQRAGYRAEAFLSLLGGK